MRSITFALLALSVSSFAIACSSDAEDPAASTGNKTSSTGGSATGGGGTTANGGNTVNGGSTAIGGSTANGGSSTGGANGGTTSTGGSSTGGTTGSGECPPADVTYLGQVGGKESPDGGKYRKDPYDATYDAGLAAVAAAKDGDIDLAITGATVVATRFKGTTGVTQNLTGFWLADGKSQIKVDLYYPGGPKAGEYPAFDIRVGHKISFKAKNLAFKTIKKASDFVLVSPDNEVYVYEPKGALTEADQNKLVRVTGKLSGAKEGCGSPSDTTPPQCLDLEYNGVADKAIYRIDFKDTFSVPGACATYVGPVGYFDGRVQFDTTPNFDYDFIYK